ncbi:MAG: TIGR03960 family B12-binding radical SAM protein [Chloroflexi bacterium]|nr:TIGR03960 family B12-binding radical SAM protein [Chloroflexota bacterium]MYD17908.1 TIGR03960 family B12-binding radical SAM protein [Chloroflexota bacterium]
MSVVDIDPLLSGVSKPARYVGGEWNVIEHDWNERAVRWALIYPDLYDIGQSNGGLAILYDILNHTPDTLAERCYTPWPDMADSLRAHGQPLFSLENRRGLRDFDALGFSLSYELTYTNILEMLDLSGIPIRSLDRTEDDPIILAGGSGALVPEPLAPFIDAFILGEAEDVILEVNQLLHEAKSQGASRLDLLRALARTPGVYVPRFYEWRYEADGTPAEVFATDDAASVPVVKRFIQGLPPILTKPIVPYLQTVHDRAGIEIQRGCTQGCRFCQAGMIYRPLRERTPEEVVAGAKELFRNTGFDDLSLVSLSSTDHSQIKGIVRALRAEFGEEIGVSLPSTRVDSFSVDVALLCAPRKKHSMTFAPEAGSQRLRNAVSKVVDEQDLLDAARNAFEQGWTSIKLYFMVGLPTETMADVEGIVDWAAQVKQIGRQIVGNRARVRVSTSNHVPKAHAPFQWARQETPAELEPKHQLLKQMTRRARLDLSWNDPQESILEGVLSRGDRRLAPVIETAWRNGARFDAWSEHFREDLWWDAMAQHGLDPAFYCHRERDLWERFPWMHIASGVSEAFLRKEWQRTWKELTTADCREGCNVCGMEHAAQLCELKLGDLIAKRRAPSEELISVL